MLEKLHDEKLQSILMQLNMNLLKYQTDEFYDILSRFSS